MVNYSSLPVPELRRSLLQWYRKEGRDLPWRQTNNLYAIWVSEVMLQQTQVKTVIPYYQRWLQLFPTVTALAQADLQTVLKAWEGLGYYARARNLHQAAKKIIEHHDGLFPEQLTEVLALPGIGRTTAGGILSAALNQSLAILDGNVKRVLARLIALPVPPNDALDQLWSLSETLLDPWQSRDFNQAIMDLGAIVCTRSQPRCSHCPWQSHCQAYNKGIQTQLPLRKMSAPLPHKRIGVAVVINDQNQILIDRRPPEGLLGGLWEFPGGKIEANETVEDCIKREILEEIGIEITVGKSLITIDHAYTHFRVTLYVHLCQYVSGTPRAIECEEVRWVTLEAIDSFPFPKANTQIIAALKALPINSL
ncbi:MAG: A/G-specific adenine glycosylase [Woronichinia naegeliana WA131]|uniref:Adenine DNA glycosylase n=1 Tax=Woronichinia naegeliana WA131 TaxID=2824559 RepID=A0A977KWB8_9CYAN|nr:MAG: A/G-specific adenine glycosylase [Woronichinia naegeliana WA131]